MSLYKLTLKDKIYLFFHEDEEKRMNYLFPKVKKHQLNWFKENGLKISFLVANEFRKRLKEKKYDKFKLFK